jgi:chromatin assembly factor 1 subunit A
MNLVAGNWELIVVGSKQAQTEYEATFLPFCLPSHTTLPKDYFEQFDPKGVIDIDLGSGESPISISDFPPPPPRRSPNMSVRDIIELLQGTSSNPITLTEEINISHFRAMEMLQNVELKYIHFQEDVRPPYCGTWSKSLSHHQWRQLAVNPRLKVEYLDYDYDSEDEWEEPEEGEDIRSQGEEEEEEIDAGDDLEGFVVDDGISGPLSPKRNLFANDMIPICSGLQWEDPNGTLNPSDISGVKVDFDKLRMGFLLSAFQTLTPPASTFLTVHQRRSQKPSIRSRRNTGLPRACRSRQRRRLSHSVKPSLTKPHR